MPVDARGQLTLCAHSTHMLARRGLRPSAPSHGPSNGRMHAVALPLGESILLWFVNDDFIGNTSIFRVIYDYRFGSEGWWHVIALPFHSYPQT